MAPILILDEPTSAQDAEAEATFREVLRTLRKETNLTIIVIAHRLSTIVDADQIVVLRNGRAEAVGGHDELMARGGWYAEAQSHQVSARSGGKGRIMIPRL
jgi:ABC-type multidrug transport system fused ATPase/permease subunit